MAQAAQAQRAQGDQLEQIIVTGTRIVRDGYEAPMLLAVMTAETLQQSTASANVADTRVRCRYSQTASRRRVPCPVQALRHRD